MISNIHLQYNVSEIDFLIFHWQILPSRLTVTILPVIVSKNLGIILASSPFLSHSNRFISKPCWLYFQKYMKKSDHFSFFFFCCSPDLRHHHCHRDNYRNCLCSHSWPVQSILSPQSITRYLCRTPMASHIGMKAMVLIMASPFFLPLWPDFLLLFKAYWPVGYSWNMRQAPVLRPLYSLFPSSV